jgi:hypothetical protein
VRIHAHVRVLLLCRNKLRSQRHAEIAIVAVDEKEIVEDSHRQEETPER